MRRFAGLLVLALVAAGVVAGSAVAKEGGVELSSIPAGTKPGDPWTPTLTLIEGPPELLAQAKPGVAIEETGTGKRYTFAAKPTADPHRFAVSVVFPREGWYSVEAYDGVTGRSYAFGQFLIEGPESGLPTDAVPPRSTQEGGFPIWPAAAGGSALFLAAFAAAFFLRRQRVRLSH
jgi:hypothetical protein